MNKYYFQILVEKTIIANDYETAKKKLLKIKPYIGVKISYLY